MKRILIVVFICVMLAGFLTGCMFERESDIVSRNISKEADNFNVTRRLTVFNIRTDTVLMQMTGNFSLSNNSTKELCVVVEIEKGIYQKTIWICFIICKNK